MTLDYTTKIEVKIHMQKYVKNMIDEFSVKYRKIPGSNNPGNRKTI